MWTGGIQANSFIEGDWDHRVLAEKALVRFDISPDGIRAIAAALDEEAQKINEPQKYYPGVVLKDEARGLVVIGKIPANIVEPEAYTTEPYWGDITLYISSERLREIADRLEHQAEILVPDNRAFRTGIKEIAEICGELVIVFRWPLGKSPLEEKRKNNQRKAKFAKEMQKSRRTRTRTEEIIIS